MLGSSLSEFSITRNAKSRGEKSEVALVFEALEPRVVMAT